MFLKIKNLKCHAILGVYDIEKHERQTVIINAKIDYNEGNAPATDKIADTMNYHTLTDSIRDFAESTNFELLEKLTNEVGKLILSDERVNSCKVEIDKPEAPIKGIESISISKTFHKKA